MGKNKNKNKKNKNKCGVKSGRGSSWEVKLDLVTKCDKAPDNVVVVLDILAKIQIDALMEEYSHIEWLAYMIGTWEEGETPYVESLFIPKQTVSSASVDNIDCPEFNDLNIIGVIHSHHGMGNGFSGTDHEWINQNHNLSICISKSGMNGQARVNTPCGSLIIVDTDFEVDYNVEFDEEEFIKQAKEKISRYQIPQTKTTPYRGTYIGNNFCGCYGESMEEAFEKAEKNVETASTEEETDTEKKNDKDVWDTKGDKDSDDKDEDNDDKVIELDPESEITDDAPSELDFDECDETLLDALEAYEKSHQ